MAEEQKTSKAYVEAPAVVAPTKEAAPAPVEVAEEKIQNPPPVESKALAVVEKPIEEHTPKKSSSGSADRDVILADLEKEKKTSFIKAWEESEKSKAENSHVKKGGLSKYYKGKSQSFTSLANVTSLKDIVKRGSRTKSCCKRDYLYGPKATISMKAIRTSSSHSTSRLTLKPFHDSPKSVQ